MRATSTSLRPLSPPDARRVADVAHRAFAGSAFYQQALGLSDAQFAIYWRAFFRLSTVDPSAKVYAIREDERIAGAIAVAFDGFPHARPVIVFMVTLLRRLGIRAWFRYLRFALAYTRVMHRPHPDRRREACGLWLFVDPTATHPGLGSALVRDAAATTRRDCGKTLYTGLIDIGDDRLVAFYRRLGFLVSPPFTFLGLRAATISWDCAEHDQEG